MLLEIIWMAIALSIDALGVGISYELKGIRVGIWSRIMIGIIAAIVMAFSIVAGQKMLACFSAVVAQRIGTVILILVGCIFIRNAWFSKGQTLCDLDNSKDINLLEAFLLGIALSADSLSIGIASAALKIPFLLLPPCVGISQILFLWLGKFLAQKSKLGKRFDSRKSGVFAGCLLILIGILQTL